MLKQRRKVSAFTMWSMAAPSALFSFHVTFAYTGFDFKADPSVTLLDKSSSAFQIQS